MRKTILGAALGLVALPAIAQPGDGERRQVGEPAGSGRYPAVAESVPDAAGYTIYRPAELPAERLPVVVWGNGGCRDNGLSASHFLREIASHGYLVIANGTARDERPPLQRLEAPPSAPPTSSSRATPPPERTADETSVAQFLATIDWAERARSSDRVLAGHIDGDRVAAMGHSCGGLQALAAGADPRVDTVVAFASGVYNRPGAGLSGVGVTKDDLDRLHSPVAYILGGPDDIAFPNGSDDFARIDHVPALLANLPVGHGGTFAIVNGGDWARVATAWLDWQLKDDPQAGKWFAGPDCRLCTTFGWTVQRKQFPELP